jgi:tRNA G18 (ribose-2'-O)-methylase SpoU
LLRNAHAFGASFVFTIGHRANLSKLKENTSKAERQIPLYHYNNASELKLPDGCCLVGIETGDTSKEISKFDHPNQAVYLLGAEDSGISAELLRLCSFTIKIPTYICLNVATTGAVVMYDRINKQRKSK